ncbi:PolC-type DNA polymerase III [Selenomonas sp. TAMA-11512]|uniref:PolC-type DNA polymerase III n=1 Tax=Selenomonas sp. TAMA-11512 TaxID=3095337 RepID=UPI003085AA38|nr:PolC-type DNA polymerase III [Selenomonas sp. TAMA-11512]
MKSEKFCIISPQKDFLANVLRGMQVTAENQKLLESCVVKHAEISLTKSRWEILLQTQVVLDRDLLADMATHIKGHMRVKEVFFYQDIIDIDASLEANWERLVKEAAEGNPAIVHLLICAKRHIDGGHLCLEIQGELAGEIYRAHAVSDRLESCIEELLGIRCQVSYQAVDEAYSYDEDIDIAYVVKRSIGTNVTSIARSETKRETGARAPGRSHAAENGYAGKGKGRGKAPLMQTVAGEAQSIQELNGEIKSVILEGYMTNVKVQEFKSGTRMLFFDIADKTNGMSCKYIFRKSDQEGFEQAQKDLKNGLYIRLKGAIRFDSYQNDFVVYVDGLQKVKLQKRKDHADVKRVELHAHTQMSNMDAVVSPETLVKTAAHWGWPAIAITDHGVVQAFPFADKALGGLKNEKKKLLQAKKEAEEKGVPFDAKKAHDLASINYDIKVIYGMEGYLVHDDYKTRAHHIIFLAKNLTGLRNLYKLVSLSNLKYIYKGIPRIPKYIIQEYREGLLVGSACEAGELIRSIVAGQDDAELEEIAAFYDYLEIQPIGNNEFLKREEKFQNVQTDEDLRSINRKVAELAKKLDKPLIATGDVHFLNPEDRIYRAILMKGRGFQDADMQPPLYLRTTEDMLEEFSYLGKEEAYAAVVENPRRIEEQIERFTPVPTELYSPMIPGAEKAIETMSYGNARRLYGENLPEVVQARLTQELTSIIGNGFSVLYLIAHKLVKKSNDDGYLVGSRGSVGSSFVATMTGITEVNPLPPHWRCPHCQHSEFIRDGSYGCGYDLPDKECPVCGTNLLKDGHDIPFAVFLGFNGDKVPDIDLNFSGVYQPTAHKYTEELFGRDNVYRAGTISTVADKNALRYVYKYFEEKGEKKHNAYISHIAKGCEGVKTTTGQHAGGIMVIPRNMDVHFFTPIQRPADKVDSTTITTHFDYHSINDRLVKLDILGHDDPTMIRMLEDLTHIDAKTIPFDDKPTMALFSSTAPIGLNSEELGANSGTYGIPEFRTAFTMQMIDDTHPACFSDLVRISGFSHGTDVWLGNAQDLIRSGQCTLRDAISARDDIMMYLIHNGIDPLLSFKTMENVRKGKGIAEDVVAKLRKGGIPEWYIDSCQKIKYMFPRAHAVAYVMMAWRIAYCKVHYPLAYYAAYFSIRGMAGFNVQTAVQGVDYVTEALEECQAIEKPNPKEKDTVFVLQLVRELYLRGFHIKCIDIYESDATVFRVLPNALLPPIASLDGVGEAAAKSIVEARADGHFTSIEDLKKRTGISRAAIDTLREHGALTNMTESDQMELFM